MGAMNRLTALAVLALSLGATQGAVAAEAVTVASLPQGSLSYSTAAGVAKVITEKTKTEARAVGHGGSNVYLPQINSGELAFGIANDFEVIFAVNGTGNFEGRKNPKLRMVSILMPFQVGIMVAKDSPIKSVRDLKGRPFPTDYTSQKLVSVMLDSILAGAEMSVADLERVPVPNFVKGAELLAAGKVDGVLLAPGSAIVAQTDAKVPVRFIDVPDSPEAIMAMDKVIPGIGVETVKPREGLVGITEPAKLMSYNYVLLTGEHVPDQVVYDVLKALHGNKDALVASHGIFRGFNPQRMAVAIRDVQYHPGAEKFFKEMGAWPPKAPANP